MDPQTTDPTGNIPPIPPMSPTDTPADNPPIDDVLNDADPDAVGAGVMDTKDQSLLTGPGSLGGGPAPAPAPEPQAEQKEELEKTEEPTQAGVNGLPPLPAIPSMPLDEEKEVQDVSTGDTIVPMQPKLEGDTEPGTTNSMPEPAVPLTSNSLPPLSVEPAIQVKPPANTTDTKSLLAATYDQGASDLHLAVGYPPMIRVDGNLSAIGAQTLTKEQVKEMIQSVLSTEQKELLEVNKEVDLAIDYEDKARFRVNAFTEKGVLSAAFRLIPSKIKTLDELNLPKKLHEFCKMEQGLILITGPTGHGKSTTLAALLQEINQNQDRHIVTIEDPIEYVFPKSRGLVQQRELHQDTHSWEVALRSVLREDPDVVMVGEMRDFETIAATITVAETGHLVFATLHTNSAAQSIDRIIDVFPPHQQGQIRVQLANVIEGVISQRLLPKIGGGRIAAVELMLATPAVRNLIREQKTYQIDNVISTSFDFGMQTIERALAGLVSAGSVDIETAKRYSVRPEELDKLLNRNL